MNHSAECDASPVSDSIQFVQLKNVFLWNESSADDAPLTHRTHVAPYLIICLHCLRDKAEKVADDGLVVS